MVSDSLKVVAFCLVISLVYMSEVVAPRFCKKNNMNEIAAFFTGAVFMFVSCAAFGLIIIVTTKLELVTLPSASEIGWVYWACVGGMSILTGVSCSSAVSGKDDEFF